MHLDWDDLQTVESLVRTGSLVAAARELGLSHTSVSRRIERLERSLGLPLFLKTAPLRPTALASTIAGRAAPMRARAQELEVLLEGAQRRAEGQLVIATNEVLAPLLFGALRELDPGARDGALAGIQVEVRVSDAEAELAPGITDLALRPSHTPGGALRGQRLGTLRLSHFRPAGARGAPWVQPSDSLRARASMRWLSAIPRDAPGPVRCDSLLALRDACVAGLGQCVLPTFLGADDPRLVRVRDVEGGTPVWLLSPAVHPGGSPQRRLRLDLSRILRGRAATWER